ncbi:MAG: hypothetical protein O2894_05340 [Planctomycetota bacterium]|nr:hypothetical protein [Planctomycetota bacterium]
MTQRPWLMAALVVVAVTAYVHRGSLAGTFVYDDHRFIEHNAALADLSLSDALRDPATASAGDGIVHDIYRPLRTVLFATEYALFVDEAVGAEPNYRLPWWHAVSLLLHLGNAVLVLLLLRPLLRGHVLPALFGALFFGVHPITSESVAWLSSQGDLLALTCGLGALVVLERRGLGRTLLGGALFFLACMAKESALMLPLLLPLRDFALPRGAESPWGRATAARTAWLAALAGAYLVLRGAVLPGLAQIDHPEGGVWATARAMLDGLVWYGRALVAPSGFSFDTRIDVPERWSEPEVWVGLGLLGTLLAASAHGVVARRPLLTFVCLGMLVALVPVSNVIVPLKTFVADRFFYAALPCAAAGVGGLLLWLPGAPRVAAMTVLAGVLGVFAWITVDRNAAWANETTLWSAVRADRPWNANAWQGLAFEAARGKRIQEAERAYATYLEANPYDAKSMVTMGHLFGELADGLAVIGPVAPGEEITTSVRRKQSRVAQIRLYQRAFEVWDRPGGLALGRGSREMVVDMLDHWIEAATDLGDLLSAKFANDRAIRWESEGALDAQDPAAVAASGSWKRRRIRVELAIRAVKASSDREVPRGMREEVTRARTQLLIDAGFDADQGDVALRPAFLDRLAALEQEATASGSFLPDEALFLEQAALLLGLGGGSPDAMERAARVLRRGIDLLGRDAVVLREQLAILTGRRGSSPVPTPGRPR